MIRNTTWVAAVALWSASLAFADTQKSPRTSKLSPEAAFSRTVQPFLAANCVGCHNGRAKVANLDLQQFTSADSVRANLKLWRKVAWKLETGDMPPAKTPQPKPSARKAVLKWVNAELQKAPVAQK